ncbi:phage holin [Halalkalibacter oceani]|uniref:phage holin n=1 Tax=Halalkalibacter oceani TaxID=1653776 RepID=UPI003399A1C0
MIELIQPYFVEITVGIILGLFSIVTTIALKLYETFKQSTLSNKNVKDHEYLWYLANTAFGFIEQTMKGKKSQDKLSEAILYVSERLKQKNVEVEEIEIRAAIERAVTEFNKDKKGDK